VLIHRHVQLSRSSFSLHYTGESSGVHHLNSLLRGGQYIVSSLSQNNAPSSWAFHTFTCAQPQARPTQQIFFLTALHRRIIWSIISTLCKRRPTQCSSSVSDRNPHTQLRGSLSRSVSWRMSHAAVIINTPSQLGRHSPSGQVSHGST
jgi:hypothetical protein